MPILFYGSHQTLAKRLQRRKVLRDWLATFDFTYFVTLNFNRPTNYASAKRTYKNLLARIDHHILGRNWAKAGKKGTLAIAFGEHPNTNLHLHVLIKLPDISRVRNCGELSELLSKHWKKLVLSGTIHVTRIHDSEGASRYSTKDSHLPGHDDMMVISSEFY